MQFNPAHGVTGHDVLDSQHRKLMAGCKALATIAPGEAGDAQFRRAFDELVVIAREHLSASENLLASNADDLRENVQNERDEFGFLAAEVMTTENFDREELQRFLTLWLAGHVVDCVRRHRAAPAENA